MHRLVGISSGTAAAIIAVIAGLQAQTQTPAQPSFRGGTELVVVPVVVHDRKGNDVTTLSMADFEVFEDGRRVAVETFVAPGASDAETGRFVVVVVDNVTVPAELFWRTKSIATKFVDRLGEADRAAVIALSGGSAADTSSKTQLKADIQRIGHSAAGDVRELGRTATDSLQAIAGLAERLVQSPHRRKVMVFVGPPTLFGPNEPSAFEDGPARVSPVWYNAIDRLGQANVALYAIDPRGHIGTGEDFATGFAAATGGVAFANTNGFDRAVDRIWRDAGVYYLLGYRPPVNDHRAHTVRVRVNVPGVTVRARRVRG